MEDRLSLRDWIVAFKAGDFDSPDVMVQIKAGWYDWFCKNGLLRNKTIFLGKKVCSLANSKKVDLDSMYVFFKNNCPLYGKLYDSFSFSSFETGDVIWHITPSNGHDNLSKGKAEVCGSINAFESVIVSGDWDDVVEYFYSE